MGKLIYDGVVYAGGVVVDSALSTTSTNPVQNKVVAEAVNTINTHLNDKLDSKYAVKKIWSGTLTFATGRTTLSKTLYQYDVTIPLMGACLNADTDVNVSLDVGGNTKVCLPYSTSYSGNLMIDIYGIGYNS
jgi:hypothetical protein